MLALFFKKSTKASSIEEAFFVFHHLLKHTSPDLFCDFISFSVTK
jgi:hypothetical protein